MSSKLQDSYGDSQDMRDIVGSRIASDGLLERNQNKTWTQVYRA